MVARRLYAPPRLAADREAARIAEYWNQVNSDAQQHNDATRAENAKLRADIARLQAEAKQRK